MLPVFPRFPHVFFSHLEVRAPLLDYQVAEFAASIPSEQKFSDGVKKRILKEALVPFIPTNLLHRKKMGFSVPLAQWFRGELKQLSEKFLVNSDYGVFEYLEKSEVMKLWHDHQSCKRDHSNVLWSILMFQIWFNQYMPKLESTQ